MHFDDIPGLDDVKVVLKSSAAQRQVAHAQLFVGQAGNAQLSLALAYAAYLNCPTKTADGKCVEKDPLFSKYRKFIHPDLHFVYPVATTKKVTSKPVSALFLPDWRTFLAENPFGTPQDWATHFGAENKQCQISREESRQILRNLALKPFEASYKVVLIWQPERMHPAAANAILKILEEPAPRTLFLLVSNNIENLLSTVRSRTQVVQVRPFRDTEIRDYLLSRHNINRERAEQIAYMAEGNLRKALRIALEHEENNENELFKHWMRLCFKRDYAGILAQATAFQQMSKEAQKNLLHYSLSVIREAMLWHFSAKTLVRLEGEHLDFVKNFSTVVSAQNLEAFVSLFSNAYGYLVRNANPKITFVNLSHALAQIMR